MSSHSTNTHSAERRRSHSTPQKQSKTETTVGRSKSCDMSHTGDSSCSRLSPIYRDSFESETEDHQSHSRILESESDAYLHSDQHFDKGSNSTIEQSLADLHLSPWETWLLNKEKRFRIELQKKLSEELKQEEERRKQQEKKEHKKRLAEEQHREWVQRKLEQERKDKEQKLLMEKQEKELEEQKKHMLQVKSKEKYQEWLNKKKEEENARKKKEKEEAESHLADLRKKKDKAEQIFKEWLEQAKNKPRPTLNSYGYVNGKLTGYYDGSSYPAPSFYNPIPWKPIPVPPPPKETAKNSNGKKKKRTMSSQSYRSNITIPYKPKDNLHVGVGIVRR